ncbi:MAG: aryl-sulfate sulfotransferase [Sediminicola sp.]
MDPKRISVRLLVLLFLCGIISSCSNDDNNTPIPIVEENLEEPPIEKPEEENSEEEPAIVEGELGSVTFFHKDLIQDHVILVNDAMDNRVYLMDTNANLVHEWPLGDRKIGNDAFLLPDGTLLASLQATNPEILFGGFGGKIQLIGKNGETLWNFDYSDSLKRTHHDVEMLPNGNILAIAWEKMPLQLAVENGSNRNVDIYPESVLEINPHTNVIVWEWHSWDHLVQDFDDTKLNYGVVSQNPQLINLNYVEAPDGNIMHANGIAYDEDNDLIYLSVNFYSEVWVLDHSTTTEVAATHAGGNFGKGGDLIYRFGNPSAYNDNISVRKFYNNHFPNLFEPGKMLLFSNGGNLEQSSIFELQLPVELSEQQIPLNTFPTVLWNFTDENLYSPKVSGAVRLSNGNTLITEGDYGIWEVTPNSEVVWKFGAEGFFWRAYSYAKDSAAILALDL